MENNNKKEKMEDFFSEMNELQKEMYWDWYSESFQVWNGILEKHNFDRKTAKKELAQNLRNLADFIENHAGYPDVYGCSSFPEKWDKDPCEGKLGKQFWVSLSHPWP